MEHEHLVVDGDASESQPRHSRTASNATTTQEQKRPECEYCHEPILTIQFVRAGNYAFHKEHFLCCVCGENLTEKRPRYKDGKFYCTEDFLDKCCHECNRCGEKIIEGSVVRALGKYYHHDHFTCTLCDVSFPDGKYYDIDGKPYCSFHYAQSKLEVCAKCHTTINEVDVVNLNGGSYHVSCLRCCECSEQLAGKGNTIFQKANKIYCREDYYNLFSKSCTACGTPITKQILAVNDEFYHPECLKCFFCNVPLTEYIAVGGYLRCESHLTTEGPPITCTICHTSVVDQDPILCSGHKVHFQCFNCHACGKVLDKTTAKSCSSNNLYCDGCVGKVKKHRILGIPHSKPNQDSASVNTNNVPNTNNNNHNHNNQNHNNNNNNNNNNNAQVQQLTQQLQELNLAQPQQQQQQQLQQQDNNSPMDTPTPALDDNATPADILDRELNSCDISWKKGDVIGKGSFGKVFLGMNSNTGELLAIKQIPFKDNMHEEMAQIVTEIKLMKNLHHPNIVTLLGTQRTGNKLNILMEYVAGNSIDSLLAKFGPFVENVIQSYTRQLLEALTYCHANGVVHRDLKGKNVLVDTQGNLKLADFGSAKRFQDVLMKDAPSISYNYTPLWTAPEVLTGDYNSKVDIWSLGCVVIEMATAKSPWHECNFEHAFRALNYIASSNETPKIPSTLSPEGKDFLRLCLQREPDLRPTAKELLQHPWVYRKGNPGQFSST